MKLADAVESWGRSERDSMTRSELEELAVVWRVIRSSSYGSVDVAAMTKDDARSVMALFDADDRRSVSKTLNRVRAWSMHRIGDATTMSRGPQESGADEVASGSAGGFSAAVAGTTGTPTVVIRGDNPALEPIGSAGEVSRHDDGFGPPSGSVTVVDGDAIDEAPAPTDHGPVDGWVPASSTGDAASRNLLYAVIGMAVLALVLWAMVIFGGDDTPTDTTTSAAASADVGSVDAGDFCSLASELDRRDPLTEIPDGEFTADWFVDAQEDLRALVAISPLAVQGDFTTTADYLAAIDRIAVGFGHDRTVEGFGAALAFVDVAGALEASDRIDAFLQQVCGLEPPLG